ncbi:KIR protein [Plasmodium coatneyi]|uniref:KIR protein n=1 Tax=Plasmodium coatneyi TaxID=208452 RepID=A0A1B1E618_9APIC|nr:KIR protein [Plasmodium coatneyi]ANQ10417.1 KIR protein [Plasmodium coatneyi]
MEEVHNVLKKMFSGDSCKLMCTNNGKIPFGKGKIVYEYFGDYPTLQSQLGNGEAKTCDTTYHQHIQKIEEACARVIRDCRDNDDDPFCMWFNEENKKDKEYCGQQKLNELKCNKVEDELGESGILGSNHLNQVKSTLPYYKELDGGSKGCDKDSNIVQNVKDVLRRNIAVDNNAERIVDAWCYTYGIMNGNSSNNEYCDALYYWIGHTVSNGSWDVRDLRELIKDLYQEFKGWKPIAGCNSWDTNISDDLFNERKQVFDYLQQCNIIKAQLQQSKEALSSNKAKCEQSYYNHLEEVIKKLTAEETKCKQEQGGSVTDPYCKSFLAMCQQCAPQELSKLKCEVPKTEETEHQTQTQPQTEDITALAGSTSSTADPTIPAAVSGGLATIGIPAIAFFLYKYTSVFDSVRDLFIGGSSGSSRSSGNRTKRSIEHHFDTLTEDSSTTLYTTTDNSTIDDDSMTEYCAPQSERRRSNNRQQERQRNKHNRNNIRYQAI